MVCFLYLNNMLPAWNSNHHTCNCRPTNMSHEPSLCVPHTSHADLSLPSSDSWLIPQPWTYFFPFGFLYLDPSTFNPLYSPRTYFKSHSPLYDCGGEWAGESMLVLCSHLNSHHCLSGKSQLSLSIPDLPCRNNWKWWVRNSETRRKRTRGKAKYKNSD